MDMIFLAIVASATGGVRAIFAEDPGSWTAWAVVGAMVTTLGAFGTAVLGYLSTRDKLKYDAELAQLRKDVAESRAEHEKCQAAQRELEKRANEAERKAAENSGLIRGMEAELSSLRDEVRDLRNRQHPRDRGKV